MTDAALGAGIAGVISVTVAIATLVLAWYVGIYRAAERPNVITAADHYFVDETLGSHDYLISNRGKVSAQDVGLHVVFEPRFPVQAVRFTPEPSSKGGGIDETYVEFTWKELGPKNQILARIMTLADKEEPGTIYPLAHMTCSPQDMAPTRLNW